MPSKQNTVQIARSTSNKFSSSVLSSPKAILALLAGILLLAASIQLPDEFWQSLLQRSQIESDLLGFVSLTCIYLLAVLLMAPLSPFALAAGVLFGFWWGTFLALLALNMGAALAFLIARYLLRQQFSQNFSGNGKMALLAKAMRGDAVTTIAILRLNPIVPFNLQNYVCGATGVRFTRYALGTFVGAAPFTVALVYLGHAGRQLLTITGLQMEQWTLLLFVVGLVLTLPMTWVMLRNTFKYLRECRDNDKAATKKE